MKVLVFILTLFYFLIFSTSSLFAARNLNISIDKPSLYGEDELVVTADQTGFTAGETIYIKGAFYQEGSTNYFGYTKSNDSWIKNGDPTISQRSVVMGSWDGKLIVRSDLLDTGYKGEGDYLFKVGFYYITTGGAPSSVNWSSNSASLILNEPANTPAPTSPPTSIPTPTTIKTPTPTLTPTQIIIPVVTTPILTTSASQGAQEILGESSVSAEEKISEIPKKTKLNSDNLNILPFFFVIIGCVAILVPITILYPNIKKIIIKEYGKRNE
jgi:hypothetical protein